MKVLVRARGLPVFTAYKTEIIGISAEVAIADEFDVPVSDSYRSRSNALMVERTRGQARELFQRFNIPKPLVHAAQGGSAVDFILENEKSLSVKTNQKGIGKVAPQRIGQPTAATFWRAMGHLADQPIPSTYRDQAQLFKIVAITKTAFLMHEYWRNLFDTDYLVYFYDFLDSSGSPTSAPRGLALERAAAPTWDPSKFSFTQTLNSWNESNTVRYAGKTLGEFQVHSNRDCFKFRFNMQTVFAISEER